MNSGEKTPRMFLTGSVVYGVTNPDSDIDVVMNHDHAVMLRNFIEFHLKLRMEPVGGYRNSFKAEMTNLSAVLNVIALELGEMDAWWYATKCMRELPPIEDKQVRRVLFKGFCGEYNGRMGDV